MEIPCALICGLLMGSLFLVPSGETLPVVLDKVPAANRTANVTVTDVTPRANVTRVEQGQKVESRGKSPPPSRRKQTNKQTNKHDKRKNCFGFKMDRISDLSGMGCKKELRTWGSNQPSSLMSGPALALGLSERR